MWRAVSRFVNRQQPQQQQGNDVHAADNNINNTGVVDQNADNSAQPAAAHAQNGDAQHQSESMAEVYVAL
jgi:hypothetical protein